MTHEQYSTLDLIARLANRFGPASRIAKELPGCLEYLTEVNCPERPRTRPSIQWWNKVRAIARDLVPGAGGGKGEIVQRNATLFGDHFGLSPVETSMLTFVALYKLFDGFEHVVDGALETKEATVPLLLSWFCAAPEPEIRAAMRTSGRLHSTAGSCIPAHLDPNKFRGRRILSVKNALEMGKTARQRHGIRRL